MTDLWLGFGSLLSISSKSTEFLHAAFDSIENHCPVFCFASFCFFFDKIITYAKSCFFTPVLFKFNANLLTHFFWLSYQKFHHQEKKYFAHIILLKKKQKLARIYSAKVFY